jgi:hypothetical protein
MLMGIESDVAMDTLQALRADGVLGLPMHGGIIVPASAEARACELLRIAGRSLAGVALRENRARLQAEAAAAALPADLRDRVRLLLEQKPELPWDLAVAAVIGGEGAR